MEIDAFFELVETVVRLIIYCLLCGTLWYSVDDFFSPSHSFSFPFFARLVKFEYLVHWFAHYCWSIVVSSRKMAVLKSFLLTKILSMFTYFSPLTTIFLSLLTVYFVAFKWRRRRMEYLIEKLPGPVATPLLGNILEVSTGYDGSYKFWSGMHCWTATRINGNNLDKHSGYFVDTLVLSLRADLRASFVLCLLLLSFR